MEFELSRLPRLLFGAGTINQLPGLIQGYGKTVLILTGGRSWATSPWWPALTGQLDRLGMDYYRESVNGEPSPEQVDQLVADYADKAVDVVVAIGGGSAMDAGKAVAGLLRVGRSVLDYLEGVGPELPYQGPAVPFIALPTTAGTGSEATKNGVLSRHGSDGFKKSFRSELLMAREAIIDPDLLATCPPGVIAANGMDALTQLIESYVSLKQNEFCNTLGEKAIRLVRDGLIRLHESAGEDADARGAMAFAALASGINLAQTGLGSVHGLASPLGAFFPIPHGVACGALLAEATEVNIRAMQQREPDNPALERYRQVGQMLCGSHFPDQQTAFNGLLKRLWHWTEKLQIPTLAQYGMTVDDIDLIVANVSPSSMQTNPVRLTDDEIAAIVRARL
jgi:alcohol dehydrogenase